MLIPHRQLSPEALRGIIEDFATRDGTDYGEAEASLEAKASQIEAQLAAGRCFIVYDPELQSLAIVGKDQLPDGLTPGV